MLWMASHFICNTFHHWIFKTWEKITAMHGQSSGMPRFSHNNITTTTLGYLRFEAWMTFGSVKPSHVWNYRHSLCCYCPDIVEVLSLGTGEEITSSITISVSLELPTTVNHQRSAHKRGCWHLYCLFLLNLGTVVSITILHLVTIWLSSYSFMQLLKCTLCVLFIYQVKLQIHEAVVSLYRTCLKEY